MSRSSEAVLAVDLGTGSVKAAAFTPGTLELVARASVPLSVLSPRAGWAEASSEDWLEAAGRAVARCLERCGNPPVLGLGLAGQMHGVVLCRGDGSPTRPPVLWADTRSSEEVARLRRAPAAMRARLANPIVSGMAAPTLSWLARHEMRALDDARWALQPKDWIRLMVTGEGATEPSDASATLLWDLPGDGWYEEMFELLKLPRRLAAPLAESAAIAGNGAAGALGGAFASGVPVVHGGADTACALFGASSLPPGAAQISIGTGAQVVVALDSPQVDLSGRTHLYRGVLPRSWYAMGAIQNAGLAIERAWRWLGIGWEEAYSLFEQSRPGAAGVTFVPHLSGERTPYVDSSLRGGWLGLGLEHTRADLVRSVLEGVAFAIREAVEALRSAGHPIDRVRLVGGGSHHPLWRTLLADVLGLSLTVVAHADASARGAARLACEGIGIDTRPVGSDEEDVEPDNPALYEEPFERYRARVPVRVWPDSESV